MLDGPSSEELEIMEESSRPPRVLAADVLETRIGDLCNGPARTLPSTASAAEAAGMMGRHGIGAVLVVDGGRLVGIVSERDLVTKVLGRLLDAEAVSLAEVMTPRPSVLQADDELRYVLHEMHLGSFRHVPVVDGAGNPAHMLSVRDVLGLVVDHFAREVVNLPPQPPRSSSPPELPGS